MSVGSTASPPSRERPHDARRRRSRQPSLDDAVDPAQIRRDPHVGEPELLEEGAGRVRLPGADLERERAARREHGCAPRATASTAPSAAQRRVWLPVAHLRLEPGRSAASTYGGFETTRSQAPSGSPSKRSCRQSSTARPVRATFSAASASASVGAVDPGHDRTRVLVGDRERDRARAGADVEHARPARARRRARARARRGSPSRAAGSAPAGRRSASAGGTPTRRARTGAARAGRGGRRAPAPRRAPAAVSGRSNAM